MRMMESGSGRGDGRRPYNAPEPRTLLPTRLSVMDGRDWELMYGLFSVFSLAGLGFLVVCIFVFG